MNRCFFVIFLLQILLSVLGDEDKKFILRVIGSTGTNLYLNHEKLSGIVGSIGEGSVIGAYEKFVHKDGSIAYRVGNEEGWVIEGIELVSDSSSEEEAIDKSTTKAESEIDVKGEVEVDVKIDKSNSDEIKTETETETKIIETDEVATEMKKKNVFVTILYRIKKLVSLFLGRIFRRK